MRGASAVRRVCAMVRAMAFGPNLPLLVGFALATRLSAPLSPPIETVGYETAVTTRIFEVLDVDHAQGRVLFRHVFVPLVDEAHGLRSVVDCAYPTLGPKESEIIGVYDVERDAYDTVFVVHPPAETKDACASAGDIGETRAALRAYVDAAALSLEARPVGVTTSRLGDAFIVFVNGKPGRVRIETRRATREERAAADGSGQSAVALGRLYVGETVLYERLQPLEDTRSVGREIDFLALYVDGTSAIALERFSHRPEGETPRTLFRFSRVLDLTGAPPPTDEDARAPENAAPVTDDPGEGSCCGTNPLLSCGCLACVAPLVSCGACATCCNWLCGPGLWRDSWEDAPPREEEKPREERRDQDQIARMRF
jgi:hypothetical protein